MQTDLYTKAVLTVIAFSLATIALQHAVPSAFAQSGIQKVAICDPSYTEWCAEVTGRRGELKVKPER
jgi:hypothetical protein